MGNSLKLIISYINSGHLDNLKIATFLLAISSFFMMNLFSLASVSPFDVLPFDDIVNANNNIFFTYFLDFSGVVSSILLVLSLVLFIYFQVMMISFYMNSQSSKWLLLIIVAAFGFYWWVGYIQPTVSKFEDKYLSNYIVADKVYSDQYNEAYGIVGSEKISEHQKAYLNAQISADQYKQYPNSDNEFLLRADTVQLNNVLLENKANMNVMDSNIVYKIYVLAGENPELKELQSIKNEVDREAYFYGVLILIFYILAFHNIYQFRRKSGMY